MSYEQGLKCVGLVASADLSASQFCFVSFGSTGLALPSAGGDADGVLQDKPNALGVIGEVAVAGISKVIVGSAGVTEGDLLQVESTGKVITAATTGHKIVGKALATGASGVVIPALIQNKGAV
jgi:hypothetical protein